MQSINGTYINGILLKPRHCQELKNNDVISFAPDSEKFIFQYRTTVPVDNISDEQLNLIADSVQEFSSTSTSKFFRYRHMQRKLN